jgi:hypothetical protein
MSAGETSSIDYGVAAASGDSRYIVNSQVIKYGPANFSNDAGIKDIIYPSEKIEHGRYNPTCGRPKIKIVNNGSTELKNLTIEYGIIGGPTSTYEWSGNLDFLEDEEVELYYLPSLAINGSEETFYARVVNANDEYANNNELESKYTPVKQMSNEVIIHFKTNNNANETGYKVYDEYGDIVLSRGPFGLTANTNYYDTLSNIDGCHKVVVTDSGNNGLQWWANPSGGAGFIRIKNPGDFWNTFPVDFGKYYELDFVAGMVTNTNDVVTEEKILLYPNPTTDQVQVIYNGAVQASSLSIIDHSGRIVQSQRLDTRSKEIHKNIDVSFLVSGVYIMQIIDTKGVHNTKFIKI